MPADFPPWSTVYDCLAGWEASGATAAMHDELRAKCRIAGSRKPEPTAAVIDSQSVKAAETITRTGRGFDAAKKINGRKRHIATDVLGLLLVIVVTAASIQDRDGARRQVTAAEILWRLRAARIEVRVEGDALLCRPSASLPADLRTQIAERKSELLSLLRPVSNIVQLSCPGCGRIDYLPLGDG